MSREASNIFPERLKTAREQRGFTQGELAKKASLQASAISHFETGGRKPSFNNLKRLADALEVTIDYLLGRTNDPGGIGPTTDRLHRHLEQLSESDRATAEGIIELLVKQGQKSN